LDVLDAVQRLQLPYTTIDVGWWSQQMIPSIPSGRTDHAAVGLFHVIPGDGNVPIAVTDFRDIGTYAVKIITDPRTLNKRVLAYTEVLTFDEIIDILSKLSGEKIEMPRVSLCVPSPATERAHLIHNYLSPCARLRASTGQ
jgi:uncharacterized protein YbjT (DUF2867 family)